MDFGDICVIILKLTYNLNLYYSFQNIQVC